jgi:hypothetical protein
MRNRDDALERKTQHPKLDVGRFSPGRPPATSLKSGRRGATTGPNPQRITARRGSGSVERNRTD